jgi:hypothetical protein
MLLCFGRKQKRLNVFSHILDLRSKEASDERRVDCHLLKRFVRRVFKKRREGKRKGGSCDHFEGLSAGVEAFTAFSN